MEATLQEHPPESDPRWTNTPPDPIPQFYFSSMKSRIQSTIIALPVSKCLYQEFTWAKIPDADCRDGITDEEAYFEVVFDLSYDIASLLQCASNFFYIRFLRDEHEIL